MLTAKDIMTREVVTVAEDTTLEALGRLFIEKGISGAPVVDDAGELVGVVTENDLISQNSRLHIPTILRLFDAFIPLGNSRLENEIKRMASATVGGICTRDVVSLKEGASLEEIATIMSERKIHLLPVVRDKKTVGIVAKKDLIRGLTGEAAE